MRLGVSLLALAGVVLVLAGLTAAAGTATFADAVGDGGVAPDVTNVTVSNDDQGLITFKVTLANRTKLGPDEVVAILLGTDDPDFRAGQREDAVNFVLGFDGTSGAFLYEWNGADMEEVTPSPVSLSGSFSGGVATVGIRQEDLAPGFPDLSVPIQLDFVVLGIAFNGSDILAQDEAPETASWTYRLVEPLRVVITNFHAGKTIKAGKTLVVLMGAAHADTGAAVKAGRIACRARLGSTALTGSGRFVTFTLRSNARRKTIKSPNATCSWKIPPGAKGKTIRGSMTFTESGISSTRSFTTRVR